MNCWWEPHSVSDALQQLVAKRTDQRTHVLQLGSLTAPLSYRLARSSNGAVERAVGASFPGKNEVL